MVTTTDEVKKIQLLFLTTKCVVGYTFKGTFCSVVVTFSVFEGSSQYVTYWNTLPQVCVCDVFIMCSVLLETLALADFGVSSFFLTGKTPFIASIPFLLRFEFELVMKIMSW